LLHAFSACTGGQPKTAKWGGLSGKGLIGDRLVNHGREILSEQLPGTDHFSK
jgi:hypothetical protein